MVHFIAAQVFDHEINVTIQPLALKMPRLNASGRGRVFLLFLFGRLLTNRLKKVVVAVGR